ncbi:MAG: hypothetical protein LBI18_05365 [Planctomycetaceae bacterium]|nr:hypothetical protein [Planctomycetaceae bacterium]
MLRKKQPARLKPFWFSAFGGQVSDCRCDVSAKYCPPNMVKQLIDVSLSSDGVID